MRTISLLFAFITVLLLVACNNGGKNGSQTTDAESVVPDVTDPTQTSEADTTAPETTTETVTTAGTTTEATTEADDPIYEDGGFTYVVDVSKYLQYIDPKNDEEYLIIANRKHPLGKNYVPKNLTYVAEGQTWLLRRAAKEAFEAMRLEMQKLGVYDTYNRSTYRSYSFQNTLYTQYIERDMKKYPHLTRDQVMIIVDTYSARPGTSDHQTGLTIDFNPLNESFANLKAFAYMKENAHKFGFILRYPKGKENITGYKYEPWHWRFVGRDAATYIYEHGITLEEYMAEKNGTEVEIFDPVELPPLTPPPTTEKETTVSETTSPDTTASETTSSDTTAAETTEAVSTTAETTATEEITTADTTTEAVTTAPLGTGSDELPDIEL